MAQINILEDDSCILSSFSGLARSKDVTASTISAAFSADDSTTVSAGTRSPVLARADCSSCVGVARDADGADLGLMTGLGPNTAAQLPDEPYVLRWLHAADASELPHQILLLVLRSLRFQNSYLPFRALRQPYSRRGAPAMHLPNPLEVAGQLGGFSSST
jgi:hypothetical protein